MLKNCLQTWTNSTKEWRTGCPRILCCTAVMVPHTTCRFKFLEQILNPWGKTECETCILSILNAGWAKNDFQFCKFSTLSLCFVVSSLNMFQAMSSYCIWLFWYSAVTVPVTSLWGTSIFKIRIPGTSWYHTVLEAGEKLVVVSSILELYLFFLPIKSVTSKENPIIEVSWKIKKYSQHYEKGLAYFDVMRNLSFFSSFLPPRNFVYVLPPTHNINLNNQTLEAI